MGLREVARFASLPEAEIACAALRAKGWQAEVFDRLTGGNVWTWQQAIGGFRLMAAEEHLADACAFVSERRGAEVRPRGWREPGAVTGLPLAVMALALSATNGGWALGLLRSRFTLTRLAVVLAYAALTALVFLGPMLLLAGGDGGGDPG